MIAPSGRSRVDLPRVTTSGRVRDPELITLGLALAATALPRFTHCQVDPGLCATPKALGAALVGVVAAWLLGREGSAGWRLDLRRAALAAFILLIVASAIVGSPTPLVAAGWMGPWITAMLVFGLAARVARRDPSGVLVVVVAVAAAIATVALVEAAGLAMPWLRFRAPQSTLMNRNAVGGYMAMALWLAVALLARRPRLLAALATLAITATLVICRARGAWLATMIAGGVAGAAVAVTPAGRSWLRYAWRRLSLAVGVVGLGVLGAVCLPWPGVRWTDAHPYHSSLSRMVDLGAGTGQERLRDGRIAIRAVAEAPLLGAGPGSWRDIAAGHAHDVGAHVGAEQPSPRSDLARIAVENGLPALCALGVGVAAAIASALRAWSRASRGHALALAAALVAAAVHACGDAPLYRAEGLILISVLLGAAPAGRARWRVALPPRPVISLVAVAGVCLALAGLRFASALAIASAQPTAAEVARAYRLYPTPPVGELLAGLLGREGRCAEAAPLLDRLIGAEPHRLTVVELAARCARLRGDREAAAQLRRSALAIEPHLDEIRRRTRPPP